MTTITGTQSVPAGSYTPPGSSALPNLPAFCRVTATISPAVKIEVWMPMTPGWNGKFEGVGGGGTAGVISYSALATGLRRGYATASTDTGHVSNSGFDAVWALNRPDLVEDFGYRGTHVMSTTGKLITTSFYDKAPNYSYFVGCSKGGQQALMEAQRFPTDYDGIIAGDPANNWTRFYAGGHLWYSLATLKDPESYIPNTKTALVGSATAAACDALDGVMDASSATHANVSSIRTCWLARRTRIRTPVSHRNRSPPSRRSTPALGIRRGTSCIRVSCPVLKTVPAAGRPGLRARRHSPDHTSPPPMAFSKTWCSMIRTGISARSTTTATFRSRWPTAGPYVDAVNPNLEPLNTLAASDHLPRLQRSGHFADEQHQLLTTASWLRSALPRGLSRRAR
jgi:hypothetical protein